MGWLRPRRRELGWPTPFSPAVPVFGVSQFPDMPWPCIALSFSFFLIKNLSLSLPPTPSLRLTLGVLQIHILKQVLSLNLELTGLVRLVASELQESA